MITIPTVTLPRPLAAIGERLPQWPHSLALSTALNLALRKGLLAADELAALEDRPIRIHVRDVGALPCVVLRKGRFQAAGQRDPVALTLSATASAFAQMLVRQEDPDTLFFHRRLVIEGDTELGLLVKNMLDRIELPQWLAGSANRSAAQ